MPRPSFIIERALGDRHARSGKPCQDEIGALVCGETCVVALADGHSSSAHAEIGARLAVLVALQALVRFADGLGERGANVVAVQEYAGDPLRRHLVRDWTEAVRAYAGGREVDLIQYGSTLLFALVTEHVLLLGQLGDGDILLVDPDGTVTTPLPADPMGFADETSSLCQPEAWTALRVRASPLPAPGTLLVLATDGYSKSYATDDDFHKIGPDYLDLVRVEGIDALRGHLPSFLARVTTEGSGDDIALGLMYWPEDVAASCTDEVADEQSQDA